MQCNHISTRISNGTANILDLILTRTPQLIGSIEVLPDHFESDYLPVAFDIKIQSGRSHESAPRQVYSYKKANFTELNELLRYVPWNCAFLEEDVDCCADKVKDLFLAAADMCIPLFTVKRRTNPPWINREILRLIKKKKILWHQLKAQPSESYHSIKTKSKRLPDISTYGEIIATKPQE